MARPLSQVLHRRLLWMGVAGPVVYVLAVALGGWLWAGYSWYGESVSTLTSRGAPNQLLLQPLFAAYNVCIVAFAIGLRSRLPTGRLGMIGAAVLAAVGVAGLALAFFPQDPWGAPVSTIGTLHIVVSAIIAFGFLIAVGFCAWSLRAGRDVPWLGWFSMAMLVVGIFLGGFGVASVTAPYAGLAERMSIGTFLLWTGVTAISLLRSEPLPQADRRTWHAPPQVQPARP